MKKGATRTVISDESLKELEKKLLSRLATNLREFYDEFEKKEKDCENCPFHAKKLDSNCRKKNNKINSLHCLAQKMYIAALGDKQKNGGRYPYQTIQKLMNRQADGDGLPKFLFLYQLAKVFNCSIDDFFKDNDSKFDKTLSIQVPRNEIEFFHGTYYIYSRRPQDQEFKIGFLSLVDNGVGISAFFRWTVDKKILSKLYETASRADSNPKKFYVEENDYYGECQYVDGGFFLHLNPINDMQDSVNIIIPPLKMMHAELARETGMKVSLQAGAGILSTLQMTKMRPPLAYTFCFCEHNIDCLEDERAKNYMNQIIAQENNTGDLQYINLNMDIVDGYVSYLLNKEFGSV